MNRKKIILVVIILISLSSLPPLLLPDHVNNIIISASTILGALISIITLVIAFILYNKFGIDETIYSKRTEIVLQLLKTIRGKTFWIQTKGLKIQVPLSVVDKDKDRFKIFDNVNLLICDAYYDFISDIFEISTNYYIPKEIAEKIRIMEPAFLSFPENLDVENLGKVMVPAMNESAKWGLEDNKQISLNDFIFRWIEVIRSVEDWIKKNSFSEQSINI